MKIGSQNDCGNKRKRLRKDCGKSGGKHREQIAKKKKMIAERSMRD
jgi:hypothetical protein